MQYALLLVLLILIPYLLCVIDRRIKGCRSVVFKIISVITVVSFVLLTVYFYGRIVLVTAKVNLKSFTNLKAFFSSKMLVLIFLMLVALFAVAKFIIVSITFNLSLRPISKLEKYFAYSMLVFDLTLVPNILVNANSIAIFAIVNAIELGLVFIKLVFSINLNQRKEVLA